MSDYTGGSWQSSPNPPPAPAPSPHQPAMDREYDRNNPFDTPYQCGICYEFLTGNVDELEVHIDTHRKELSRRLAQQQNQASRQQAASSYHPGASSHFYSTASSSVPYEYGQRRLRAQATMQPAFQNQEQVYYQHQETPINIVDVTPEWTRQVPTSHAQQEGFPQMMKRQNYTEQSYEESRDDSGICESGEPTAQAAVLQTDESFETGQDDLAYHELQPMKSESSHEGTKSIRNFTIDNQGFSALTTEPCKDEGADNPEQGGNFAGASGESMAVKSETDDLSKHEWNELKDGDHGKKHSKEDHIDEKLRRTTRRSTRTLQKDFVRK